MQQKENDVHVNMLSSVKTNILRRSEK